jgi:hypothetical protein
MADLGTYPHSVCPFYVHAAKFVVSNRPIRRQQRAKSGQAAAD